MARILVLPFFGPPGPHRFTRRGPFQRLDTGHLINREGYAAALRPRRCLLVGFTDILTFPRKELIFRGVQPPPYTMGLEGSFFLKNAPPHVGRQTWRCPAASLGRLTPAGSSGWSAAHSLPALHTLTPQSRRSVPAYRSPGHPDAAHRLDAPPRPQSLASPATVVATAGPSPARPPAAAPCAESHGPERPAE